MHTVAVGIAEVVLHVADDRVLPIGEPESAVGTHFEIGRPEVGIAGGDHWFDFGAGKAGAVVVELVLQDSLKADDVANEEISLEFIWEVPAGENLDTGTGAGSLLVDLGGVACFWGKSSRPEKRVPWYGCEPVPSKTKSCPQASKTWPCGLAKGWVT